MKHGKKALSTHTQQVIVRWAIRLTALILGLTVAVGAGIVPLQNARIGALQAANQKRASENSELTKLLNSAQAQYQDLFAACQKSSECLAKAPSPTIVSGPAGQDGHDASDSQVYSQVARFCTTTNFCVGIPGTNGADGSNGTDGKNGADGAPGAQGDKGDKGDTGDPGRGITDVSCVSTDMLSTAFRFTFTDGSTEDVSAACIPAN